MQSLRRPIGVKGGKNRKNCLTGASGAMRMKFGQYIVSCYDPLRGSKVVKGVKIDKKSPGRSR